VADYSTQLLASSRIVLLGSNMHTTRVRIVCILLVCHMHMNLCMYLCMYLVHP